jgi:hypothetical protein
MCRADVVNVRTGEGGFALARRFAMRMDLALAMKMN